MKEMSCMNGHQFNRDECKEEWQGMFPCPFCWPSGFLSKSTIFHVDKSGWISVKDSLPEDGKLVLVATEDRFMDVANLYEGIWYDTNVYSVECVTHWMPLPEPPDHIGDADEMVDRISDKVTKR